MKITIQTKHIDDTGGLKEYVNEKIEKFSPMLPENTQANIFLKGKSLVPGRNSSCRVTIRIPGARTIRAKKRAGDIRSAIDFAQEKIEKQVIKFKERKAPRNSRRQHFSTAFSIVGTGVTYIPKKLWKKIRRSKKQ